MSGSKNKYFDHFLLWTFTITSTLLLGIIDWQTGYELNFFVFYFIPVGYLGWKLGRGSALGISLISSLVWYIAAALAGNNYSSQFYAVWNTGIRLCSFIIIGLSAAKIGDLLKAERLIAFDLKRTLSELKVLKGLVPICAECKKIRDSGGEWQQLEKYITNNSQAQFSHGYCPTCAKRVLEDAGLSSEGYPSEES